MSTLLLTAGSLPLAAGGARQENDSDSDRGLSLETSPAAPHDLVTALSSFDPRDPDSILQTARALSSADTSWLPPSRAEAASTEDDVFLDTVPAGDLDGDAREDLAVFVWNLGTSTLEDVTMRSGATGAALWSLPLDEGRLITFRPVGDVTGDGREDVLLVTRSSANPGFEDACGYPCWFVPSVPYEWRVTLMSGEGTVAWQHAYAGQLVGSLVAYAGTNVMVTATLGGDHDGDGSADVIVNAIDLVQSSVGHGVGTRPVTVMHVRNALVTETDATILAGPTGEPVAAFEEVTPGIALLGPLGHAFGDETLDLLWQRVEFPSFVVACASSQTLSEGACVHPHLARAHLRAIDGATLQTAWETTLGGEGEWLVVAGAARADLTGDAAEDLLLRTIRDGTNDIGVISGATGQLAWSREIGRGTYPAIGGSFDGEAASDVLLMSLDWWTLEFTLERVDGATGATLLETTRATDIPAGSGSSFTALYAGFAGDADGDGAADIVLGFSVWYQSGAVRHGYTVESGATGTALTEAAGPGFGNLVRLGDQDGDGADEVMTLVQDSAHLRVNAVKLSAPTGTLWSHSEPTSSGFAYAFPDFSGDGVRDVVLVSNNAREAVGVDGSTGSVLWRTHV